MTESVNGKCPSRDQLLQSLQDSHTSDETIDRHVEECCVCQQTMDQLTQVQSMDEYRELARTSFQASDFLEPPISDGDIGSIDGLAIESKIGAGAMGVVYRGRDLNLDRTVAIKVLAGGSGQESKVRFAREAKAAACLDHPNIVRVYSSGVSADGRPYLVMPLIEGPSLKFRLSQRQLAIRESTLIVKQIAFALAAAHENNLNHRDVKPSNILLDEKDSEAKLADFGLVQTVADETLTQRGIICGTPEYMSPEQAYDPDASDHRGDIYSLGIVLYECLSGSTPFRGRPLDVLRQHRDQDPIAPSEMNRDVPRDLDVICLKAIEKDPARRFRTAKEFADDLDCFLQGRPIKARSISALQRSIRWAKRNQTLAALLGLLFVVLLVGTIISSTLWLLSDRNWRLAEERNQKLISNQEVLQANQKKLGESLNESYFNSLQNKNEFMQLPTSLRNSILMALRNTCQLLYEHGRDDPDQLRQVADVLSTASDVAIEQRMTLRAVELTTLNCEVVNRLTLIQEQSSAADLIQSAKAYNLYSVAQYLNKQGSSDVSMILRENYQKAQQFGEAGIEIAKGEDDELRCQESEIQFIEASMGVNSF